MGIEIKLPTRATPRIPSLNEAHPALIGIEQASTSREEPVGKRPEDRQWVREGAEHGRGRSPAAPGRSRFAPPSSPFPLMLNENWRVVDDPLQWIVQQRKGNRRGKNTGWRGRLFFRTRSGLLSRLEEYCGEVDAQARAALEALPERHG